MKQGKNKRLQISQSVAGNIKRNQPVVMLRDENGVVNEYGETFS